MLTEPQVFTPPFVEASPGGTALISESAGVPGSVPYAIIGTQLVTFAAPSPKGYRDVGTWSRTLDSCSALGEVADPRATSTPAFSDALTDRVNSDRLALLARFYVAGKLPREQEARLRIATEKILRLIPSATPEDYEALAVIVDRSNAVRQENAAARERLGL